MVRQPANVVVPSPAGRWGERLSVGITRALTLGLTRRLPSFVVTATAPTGPPARRVLAEIESFEPRADGIVGLLARWRPLDGTGPDTLAGVRISLVEAITGPGNAAIVAAMSRAIETFTERVVAALRPAVPAARASR
nr:PqiC family protein [Siccirubricoccus soli]